MRALLEAIPIQGGKRGPSRLAHEQGEAIRSKRLDSHLHAHNAPGIPRQLSDSGLLTRSTGC